MLRHLASNPASGKVMQKAGLRPEGVQRKLMKKVRKLQAMKGY